MSRWLTTAEVAAELGVTVTRVNYLRRDKQLKGHMSHGKWRYSAAALAELKRKRRTNSRVKNYRKSKMTPQRGKTRAGSQLVLNFEKQLSKHPQASTLVDETFEVHTTTASPINGATGRQLSLLFDCLESGLFTPEAIAAAGRNLVKR